MNARICYADLMGSQWPETERKGRVDPVDWLVRRKKMRRRLNQVWDVLARERRAGLKAGS